MNKILNSIKLYTAADIIEAQLVQKLLASEGITTSLKNENLQSGVGELPFVEMWPELWLLDHRDLDRARQVLNDFINRNVASDWVCTICNERNPESFEICWMCAETSTDDADNLTA
jgi:hypothetical protein